jgi:DNA polymerase-3 subunit epsilon
VPGISFTAVDFATANSDRASVCGVGLVKVRNGRVEDKAFWLIKPPPGVEHFDPLNTGFRGITAEDVCSAADWEMSAEGILHFAGEDPMVGYTGSFNADVMLKASERLRLDLPAKDFYCAHSLARDELGLSEHSMNDVLAALRLPPVAHPEPGAKSMACAKVVLAIARMRRLGSVAELWNAPAVTIGHKPQGRRRK